MAVSALCGALVLASALVSPAPPSPAPASTNLDFLLASWTSDVLTGDVGGVWNDDLIAGLPSDTDVALVLGPTGISQPSDSYLQSVYNLYLNPSGLYQGSESDVYSLYTPENSGNTLDGLTADEADLNKALVPLLENGNHVTLFGYSQSTAAISHWLNENPDYAGQVNFVMVGNSASPHGMIANMYESLPTWMQNIVNENLTAWGLNGVLSLPDDPSPYITPDSPFEGAVYTLASGGAGSSAVDGYASWNPDSFTNGDWWNQLLGMFSTHAMYLGMTPQDIAASMTDPSVLGDVTYYDLDPAQSPLELLTQAAAGAGWLPDWLADSLLSVGL